MSGTLPKHNLSKRLRTALVTVLWLLASQAGSGQTPDDAIDALVDQLATSEIRAPLCFGIRDIIEPRALAICDALYLEENVRARELADAWIREQPDHPGAQFALAEVLFSVEANLPRALYHLNQAEALTDYRSLGRALASGYMEWHYLTLSQLSYVHQLMGDQENALAYLDKMNAVYGQDVESFRGWPLIKLKQWDAARASANQVLRDSDDERARARAWNTLCAVELASLRPAESLAACERAIDEDENIASAENDYDTVYLTNASEVSLSMLRMTEAEAYLDRATRFPNPDSVANPWVYKLFITQNQGRFDEAREALDRMLLWRESQTPVVGVMNRAEHLMAAASFLILAGYGEGAARLARTARNEPDRNGSFSADDIQKDALAALTESVAQRTAAARSQEQAAAENLRSGWRTRLRSVAQSFAAWQSARKAAALFAEREQMLNRLRPYAPLDVHIPEWLEPELVGILGSGVTAVLLEEARSQGAFLLNEGYYHAYRAEIAALDGDRTRVLSAGNQALALLPPQEVLLAARLHARMAAAAEREGASDLALTHFRTALQTDPGILRRLDLPLPVVLSHDESDLARDTARRLARSPRFNAADTGFLLEVRAAPELTACLYDPERTPLGCHTADPAAVTPDRDLPALLVDGIHQTLFTPGLDISDAEMSLLLGTSVIMQGMQQRGASPAVLR